MIKSVLSNITLPVMSSVIKTRSSDEVISSISGLSFWLDASDLLTITESSGLVSQWGDKSGNGNNATQGVGSLQMTTNSRTQNNLNVLDCTNDFMNVSFNVNQSIRPELTLIFVFATDVISGADTALWGNENGLSARFFSLSNTGGNAFSVNSGAGFVSVPNVNNSDAKVMSFVMRDGVTNGSEVFSNGTLQLTYTENTNDDLTVLSIGALSQFGVWTMNGFIAEVIAYSRALNQSERIDLELALISKWGI